MNHLANSILLSRHRLYVFTVCLGATVQQHHYQWERCWHTVPLKATFPSVECVKQGQEELQKCRKPDVVSNQSLFVHSIQDLGWSQHTQWYPSELTKPSDKQGHH